MFAFIAPVLASRATKMIGIILLIAAITCTYFHIWQLRAENARLTQSEQIAREAADANLAAYNDLQAKSKQLAAVISALEAEKSARNATLKSAWDDVSRIAAQPGGDGPVAPALRSALDSLRSAP